MRRYTKRLINKYNNKGILIDTNILLLHFIGNYDPNYIPLFKNTSKYVPNDYKTLQVLFGMFSQVYTTPNILTEVSNLAGQLESSRRKKVFQDMQDSIRILKEEYVQSKEVTTDPYFATIGLTDSGIKALSEKGILILTDDFRLSQILQSQKLDVINFNHIKVYNWLY